MSKPVRPEARLPLRLYLRNAFAPARCMGCLREGVWLCSECRQQLTLRPDETDIKRYISAGPYSFEAIRRGIHWLKFKGIRDVAPALALLLADRFLRVNTFSVLQTEAILIPIPLHPRKERQRGFNQSKLIAEALSTLIGIDLSDALIRTKSTWTQSLLPMEMREQNAGGAFAIRREPLQLTPLQHRKYWILLDDVATSGATLQAAANALEEIRPEHTQVWFATVARG